MLCNNNCCRAYVKQAPVQSTDCGLIAGASAFNGSRREMIEGQYTTPGHLSYKVLPLQACLTIHWGP